ncbi:uncharacterized protein METZ01_LOCUS446978 [marine metagenome]|uniref:Uncharacterized protein n=1 Tax=marine metagenome TaxID=408172 RepID=A0A382ZF14_9ZZZZ
MFPNTKLKTLELTALKSIQPKIIEPTLEERSFIKIERVIKRLGL